MFYPSLTTSFRNGSGIFHRHTDISCVLTSLTCRDFDRKLLNLMKDQIAIKVDSGWMISEGEKVSTK